MMQYRLLRDNKETGPYSADQLIKMGLKAYDLIWTDGKSAAWRYPSEMTEFKPYAPPVEEQPFDRFFKKSEKASIANSVIAGSAIETITATVAKQKPRIRIKAEWNRVETPAAIMQAVEKIQASAAKPAAATVQAAIPATPVAQVKKPAVMPSWENTWLDWKQEQKAATEATRKATAQEQKKVNDVAGRVDEPVLETKFSQSLSDIKERYTATVLKAKTKAADWHRFKGIATLALLAVPVLCFGLWMGGHEWNNNTSAKSQVAENSALTPAQKMVNTPQATETPTVAQDDNTNQTPEQKPVKQVKPKKEVIPAFDENENKTVASVPAPSQRKQPLKAALSAATVGEKKYAAVSTPSTPAQPNTPRQRYVFTQPSSDEPSTRPKVVNPELGYGQAGQGNNTPAANSYAPDEKKAVAENKSAIYSHLSKKGNIADYVAVEADEAPRESIQSVGLNVQNIADFPLDLVVIDVEYFDGNGRFKNGQTIYVKHIPEDETVNVKVPNNAFATRIKYRVSLVSAEQKGLYLIAD